MQRLKAQQVGFWFLFGLLVSVLGLAGAQDSQGRKKYGIMPAVSPDQYVERGEILVHQWAERSASLTGNRDELYVAIGTLLDEFETFQIEVAEIYPRDQLEWILITDEIADTVAARLTPVLESYQERHPEEVLTQGRQFVELGLMEIVGAPPRMLGFHVVSLSKYVYTLSDTLLTSEATREDVEGIHDGVLRNIRDWCALYGQVHNSEKSIYESRLNQEDWIIARLKDNCGQSKWKVTNQYMAMIGVDSTKTPPQDIFAHEFHLESTVCEGDSRVILVNLPNFQAMQLELLDAARKQAAEEAEAR